MTAPGYVPAPLTGWWVKGNAVPFPPEASLLLAGSNPFVRIGPKVIPTAAALALTGSVPIVRNAGKLVLPTAGALTLAGSSPTIRGGPVMRPAGASLILTGATPLVGPPYYNATGFGGSNVNGFTTSLGFNFSHTASGINRAVAVAFTSINAGQSTASQTRNVTYGGMTMTQLVTVDISSDTFLEIWGLLSPPTGPQTVQVIVSSGSNTGRQIVGSCVSYTGVSGAGATSTNTGSGTALTHTVSSAVGEMVFQAFGSVNTQAGYNQNLRFYYQVPANNASIAMGDADGAASVSFTATGSPSGVWASAAVRVLP